MTHGHGTARPRKRVESQKRTVHLMLRGCPYGECCHEDPAAYTNLVEETDCEACLVAYCDRLKRFLGNVQIRLEEVRQDLMGHWRRVQSGLPDLGQVVEILTKSEPTEPQRAMRFDDHPASLQGWFWVDPDFDGIKGFDGVTHWREIEEGGCDDS